jgi:DNA-binding response OmpR family regulator
MPLIDTESGSAVLVMNRSDKDAKLLRSVLRRVGFRVENVEDGNRVLDSLAAGDTSLRLVVVDPATPNLQFRPFLENLHQAGPEIPILCLSEEGTEATTPPGCAGHIARPFRRAHLLASILEITEKPLVRTA